MQRAEVGRRDPIEFCCPARELYPDASEPYRSFWYARHGGNARHSSNFMRIVAGLWRGRQLAAPRGSATRPTADRVRQALFDMLLHAPWGGREIVDGARVMDVFAGTGAFGLEALSRGAAHATFVEYDHAALAALTANIAACEAHDRATVLPIDALATPPGSPADLVFLDPPYRQDLISRAIARLRAVQRLAPHTLLIAETARDEPPPATDVLAERCHGVARISIWRFGP